MYISEKKVNVIVDRRADYFELGVSYVGGSHGDDYVADIVKKKVGVYVVTEVTTVSSKANQNYSKSIIQIVRIVDGC